MPNGITLNAGVVVGSPIPLDAKYGPYDSVALALSDLSTAIRHQGLTVGIKSGDSVVEYWFKDGVANENFVEKQSVADWNTLANKPETFTPSDHEHTLSKITDAGTAAASDSTDFATAAQGALADTAVQPADLAAVATSGDYDDLTNKPTLGTAAASDTTAFAAASHVHPASEISDSTDSGRTLLTSSLTEARAHLDSFPTFADRASFPATGELNRIYTALDTFKTYVWVTALSDYVEISPTTIEDKAVTNAKLADMPWLSFKGRLTSGSGVPEDLTSTQAKTLLQLAPTSQVTFQQVTALDTNSSDSVTLNFYRLSGWNTFIDLETRSLGVGANTVIMSWSDTAITFKKPLIGAPVEFVIACSDETTALTAGNAKVTFRAPVAFELTSVSASVTIAPTGSTLVVDINNGPNSVLSTELSIDIGAKTSATAATPAVIDTSFRDFDADDEITIDLVQPGSLTAGAGLKVTLRGTRL